MATYTGTAGNDSWTVINPGTFTLDGLGGTDTLYLGTSLRSDYTITRAADGTVHVDSVSGASQQLHATLVNMEVLVFNNKRDTLDLATYFAGLLPPTATLADDAPGTAIGNVTYTVTFSKSVTGLAASDFTVTNGSLVSVTGSGASYSVVVALTAATEGTLTLTLKAASVTDSSGSVNASAVTATQPIDTRAPVLSSASPASGAGGVAVGTDLVFTFSEAIQRGSGAIVLKNAAGTTVASWDAASSADLSISGSVLTINPSSDLAAGTGYSVQFAAGAIKDAAGNAYAGTTSVTFTTAAGTQDVIGTGGNDVLAVSATGAVHVDGQAGLDTAVLPRAKSAYGLKPTASGYELDTTDGSTTIALDHIERLQFSDGKLALDLTGHAGEVAKLLGAIFGAGAVALPDYVGIGLGLSDGGMSDAALAQLALDARLGAGASNKAVVDLLYTNVVGSAPSAEAEATYVALLDDHTYTPAALAQLAADTKLNLAHIDLAGLVQHGLAYIGG